jgi:hypothetical protein
VRSGLPKIGPRRPYNDAWMRKRTRGSLPDTFFRVVFIESCPPGVPRGPRQR